MLRLRLVVLTTFALLSLLATGTAVAAGEVAQANGSTYPIAGTNIARGADELVVYTRVGRQTASPANRWGAEASVLNSVVQAITDRQTTRQPGTAIPVGGSVLSGNGAARLWILANLRVGQPVTYQGSDTAPTPTPTPSPAPSPGTCSAGYVRLTFDDGPDPVVTPQVLDTLRTYGAKATFFVMGQKVQARPDLVLRQQQEGHKVGNHTWDHPYLTRLTAAQQSAQLRDTSAAIVAAGAPSPVEWRPPYEDWNASVRDLATSLGMTMVLWNYETDSNDWQGGSPTVIRDRVVTNAHDGAIILMHDRIQNSATALPGILDGLAQKGLCLRP